MQCPECKGLGGDYVQDGEGEVKRDSCSDCEGTGETHMEESMDNELLSQLETIELELSRKRMRLEQEAADTERLQLEVAKIRWREQERIDKMLEDQAHHSGEHLQKVG